MKKLFFTTILATLFIFMGNASFAQDDVIYPPRPETIQSGDDSGQSDKNIGDYEPYIGQSNLTKPEGFGAGGGERSGLDSKGNDFWLLFMRNYDGVFAPVTLYLDITCDQNASGTVSIPGLAFSTNFTVPASTVTRINIPLGAMIMNNNTIQSLGVHVVSDIEVTVYGMNRIQYTTDGFLGLPVDVLGTQYVVMTYPTGTSPNNAPIIGIVSPFDNNTVTITPSAATFNGNPAGVPFNVVLNQGQTYMVSCPTDLTGSMVSSTSPVAVFGGNACANVPVGYCCCDHLVEQIPPVSTWGETFVTHPLEGRASDTWRFLASENGTQLTIDGVNVAVLNFGDFYETTLSAPAYIVASNPILAVQFSNGTSWDGVVSDPFMMIVPPYQQFLGGYVFSTPASGFNTNYFNSAVVTPGVPGMQLSGNPLNPANYSAVGASGYSAASFPVNINTSYVISNTLNVPSGLYLYGFDSFDSYGYPGGQAFGAIATITSLTLTPVSGSAVINTNQCWQAELLDQFGAPVPGVRVDFTITGPHSGNSGFAFTDVSGIATYCFTGTIPGTDIIVANVGSLNDTAQFEWRPEITVPISNWALYLGIMLAVSIVVIRFRKMI